MYTYTRNIARNLPSLNICCVVVSLNSNQQMIKKHNAIQGNSTVLSLSRKGGWEEEQIEARCFITVVHNVLPFATHFLLSWNSHDPLISGVWHFLIYYFIHNQPWHTPKDTLRFPANTHQQNSTENNRKRESYNDYSPKQFVSGKAS